MELVEIWKAIPEFEDLYIISNYGKVKSIGIGNNRKTGQIISTWLSPKWNYENINLYKNGNKYTFTIHQLVASIFIGNCPEGYEVNHIDNNKSNNRLDNLEYLTHSENMIHAYNFDRNISHGESHGRAKLILKEVLEIKELLKTDLTQKEIGLRYNIKPQQISRIKTGKRWANN